MPYICLRRSDIPDGTLQVLDLKPNTSQRSLIYDGPGQTKYVNRVQSDTVKTSGAGPITMSAEYKGLAAYLIDMVEADDGAGATRALTAAEANAAAAQIITSLDAGAALTKAALDTAIQGHGLGAEDLTANGGSVADVLKILAGGEYVVPAGATVEDGANAFVATQAGSFTEGVFRHTYASGSLAISAGEGAIAQFASSDFTYNGLAGAALIVYADDGTVY